MTLPLFGTLRAVRGGTVAVRCCRLFCGAQVADGSVVEPIGCLGHVLERIVYNLPMRSLRSLPSGEAGFIERPELMSSDCSNRLVVPPAQIITGRYPGRSAPIQDLAAGQDDVTRYHKTHGAAEKRIAGEVIAGRHTREADDPR